jgi:hypothetical protein
MGVVAVEGLGDIEIAGDMPTPDEAAKIKRALQARGVVGGGPSPAEQKVGAMVGDVPAAAALPDPQAEAIRGMFGGSGETAAQAAARQQGIGTEPAPAETRFRAGFGTGTPEEIYSRVLKGYFGPGTEVKTEPTSGKLLYRKPGADRFNFVEEINAPVSFGDLASVVGEALPLVAGAVGGAGGAMAGAPVGPVTAIGAGAVGEGFGTWAGEYARLKAGRSMGAVPSDMDDIALMRAAVPEGLQAMLGAGVASTAFSLYRRIAGRGAPAISLEEFERRWNDATEKLRGTGIQPTTGQALEGTIAGDQMLTAQQQLLARPDTAPGRAVAEFTDEQLAQMGRLGLDMKPPVAPSAEGAARMASGEQLRQIARKDLDAAIAPDEAVTQLARGKAFAAYEDAISGAVISAPSAGARVRVGLQRARQAFDEQAEQVYGPIRLEAAQISGSPAQTLATAERYAKLTGKDLIPGLGQEDSALVKSLLTTLRDDKGELKPATYEQLDRAVQAVRRAVRQETTGLPTGRDAQMLRELQGALAADREQILIDAGRTDLAQKIAGADDWYKGETNLFDSTVVRDLLSFEEGRATRPKIQNSQVFDSIMGSPDNARMVNTILNRKGFEPERQAMRDAIRAKWRETVDPNSTGKPDPTLHAQFMRQYGDQMKLFMPRAEVAKFGLASQAAKELARREAVHKEIGERMSATPIGQIANIADASEVFGKTWKAGTPEPAMVTANLLTEFTQRTGDNGPLMAYRDLVKTDIANSVVQHSAGRDYVDIGAFDQYLRSYASQIRSVMGQDYLDGLQQVRRAAEVVNAAPRRVVEGNTQPAVYHIMRAMAGLDVAANRSITAVQRHARGAAAERLKDMLLDPDEMRRVLRMRNMTPGDFARWAIAGGAGAEAMDD